MEYNEFSYDPTFKLIFIEKSSQQNTLNELRVEINLFWSG